MAASVVALCACGGGESKSGHEARLVVAKKPTSGKHASATASTDAGRYGTFFARVTAAPDQRVAGQLGDRLPRLQQLATLARAGRVTVEVLAAK